MPLIQGKSPKAFKKNIEIEMHAGKPQKQSLAIAYSVKKKNEHKKAKGGEIEATNESHATADMARDEREMAMIRHKMMAQGGTVEASSEKRPSADDDDMSRGHEKHSQDIEATSESRPSADKDEDSRAALRSDEHPKSQEEDFASERRTSIDDASDPRSMRRPSSHTQEPTALSDRRAVADMAKDDRDEAMMARGGMAMGKPKSIADAIMAKRKMYADGGEVDLSENADESPNEEDQMSFDALRKENYSESEGLHDLDYDTDKSVGDDLDERDKSDKHDMIDIIRKKYKRS